ncbi:MAG: alpha/beta hydrolase, partial [Pseudomonadota bacterium]
MIDDWDDAYANGEYIDGADAFPPRWEAAAAAFRESLGERAGIDRSYGAGPRNRFDLFAPQTPP